MLQRNVSLPFPGTEDVVDLNSRFVFHMAESLHGRDVPTSKAGCCSLFQKEALHLLSHRVKVF